jgi:hypothetical protein
MPAGKRQDRVIGPSPRLISSLFVFKGSNVVSRLVNHLAEYYIVGLGLGVKV